MMPKVKGSHPWAVILCTTSDQDVPDWPGLDYFETLMTSPGGAGLYTWWHEVSGGTLDLAGSQVFGWYPLPGSLADVNSTERGDLIAAARAAATARDADLSGYFRTVAIVTGYRDSGGVGGGDVALGVRATNGQPGWRRCITCEGIAFWDGSRDPGLCIAGGPHDHSGSDYYSLPHDTTFPNGQPGWRRCGNQCETLVFDTGTPAPCPGGGTHMLGTGADYVLRNDGAGGEDEQPAWRWCTECHALAQYDGSRLPGLCPVSVSGRHEHVGGGKYSIPLAWAAPLGFLAHETGHAFGLDHAFDTSRKGDFYNDTRPGAYGDWTDVMSWGRTASFAVPLFTPAGAGVSAPTLHKLGWLAGPDVATVVAPAPAQSFTLRPLYVPGKGPARQGGRVVGDARLLGQGSARRSRPRRLVDQDERGDNPRMLRVIVPGQGWVYTVEYRFPQSWDQGVQTGRVVIHAMRTLYQAGQDGWRRCVNCGGLIYSGQTACPGGGVHDPSGSGDYWLQLDAGRGSGQGNWRWCQNCCGLFFAGGTAGACPAGGDHDGSQSGDYALPSSGAGQANWQWCTKCNGLAFAGNSTPGVCPAGMPHEHGGSDDYVLSMRSGRNRQNKWRWCTKCQGIYYAGLGACTGGDVHVFGPDDYAPVQDLSSAVGQAGWSYCRRCYAMAFNDGSGEPGACAAGGHHDRSTSGQYVIPLDPEAEAGQRGWWRCIKCSAVNYVDADRGPGLCSALGYHSPDVYEYRVAHDTSAVSGEPSFGRCRRCENMVMGHNPPSCMAGGDHDTSASARYVVRTDPASLVREQAFWRTCTKCSTLFAQNSPDGTNEKRCAAGRRHTPTGEYFLTFVAPESLAPESFWRWCRKCQMLAYWDDSGQAGPCPAGRRHDHTTSGFYVPPSFGLDVTQVVDDNLVVGEAWVEPGDHVRVEVLAMDTTSATVRVAATRTAVKKPTTPVGGPHSR